MEYRIKVLHTILQKQVVWSILSSSKIVWSSNGSEPVRTADGNTLSSAMDNQEVTIFIPSTNDTNMGILRVENKITWHSFIPCDCVAVSVLVCSAAAMS